MVFWYRKLICVFISKERQKYLKPDMLTSSIAMLGSTFIVFGLFGKDSAKNTTAQKEDVELTLKQKRKELGR